MRIARRSPLIAAVAAVLFAPVSSVSAEIPPIPIRPELAAQLAVVSGDESLLVLVTGDSTDAAAAAVESAGLSTVEAFERLSIVAALGSPDAVRALHVQPGVLRVDANLPLEFLDDLAHRSTGVAQLRDIKRYPKLRALRRAPKTPYDGSGVSIADVDSGFDTTQEQFVEDGETKFDVHLRQTCPIHREAVYYAAGTDPTPDECSAWIPVPPNDDGPPADGHGTITAGVAAGYPRMTPSGAAVSGTAPGARLVGLSTGAGGAIYNAVSALNWVLENHADPCGDGSCPPIRVVNNSYGLPATDEAGLDDRRFDPDAPISVATSTLIDAGVVVVWAPGTTAATGARTGPTSSRLAPSRA